jgi:RHS repeat-associated protein
VQLIPGSDMSLRIERLNGGWGRLVGCALVASVISLSAHAQLAPVAGTHYAARASDTGFAGAVNSQGGYGASVPLDLPAARGGLPVPLQIAYGGNRVGAAGLGWDVPMSYIYRDTTIAHRRPDRHLGFIQVRNQLSLVLDGKRYTLVRNAADTAWLAALDAVQLEVRDMGNGTMVMYDGEGRTYSFSSKGATSGSILINGNLFLLVNIKGPDGNQAALQYDISAPTLPGGGSGLAINLREVAYNASPTAGSCFKNRITLNYKNAVSAPLAMSVLGGAVLARVKTLEGVTVGSRVACDVASLALRNYTFNYQPDTDTQLPRLESVTMTGRQDRPENTVTLPVATYSYGSIVDPGTQKIVYQEISHPNLAPPFVGRLLDFGITWTSSVQSPEPHGSSDVLVDLFSDQTMVDLNGDGRVDMLAPDNYQKQGTAGANGTSQLRTKELNGFQALGDWREKIHMSVLGAAAPGMPMRINPTVDDTLKQYIDMNGDGRLDVVETVLPDIDHWIIHLNTPDPTNPSNGNVGFTHITIPVDQMRAALNTTGLSFGRVALARRTTVPHDFSAANKLKRTITEFELRDVNGDGYPDFVYNASSVRTSGVAGEQGDMVGSRNVMVLINTAGVHLQNGEQLFAAPILLEAGGASGCGISRWQVDPAVDQTGGILNQYCGFQDVNGDGIADRFNSVREDGELRAKVALGTGDPNHPYATDAIITLPGPVGRTETTMTLQAGTYVPTDCSTFSHFIARRTRGLRDINGDGIPDYVMGGLAASSAWSIAMGTGAGYSPPVQVDAGAEGMELSLESSRCGSPDPSLLNEVSTTPRGLFDIDGDGQPEIVKLILRTGWQVLQLKPPARRVSDQVEVGPTASVPSAGRLTRIDNGYGAITHIGYKSAKEELGGSHLLPYPEIVVAAVTTNTDGFSVVLTDRYAHSGSAQSFDSARDAFVFPGYKRAVKLFRTSLSNASEGSATITDTYALAPFSSGAHTTAASRFTRYQRLGKVSDVTSLAGMLGTDPWALLATNATNDTRRVAGTHYTYDSRLLPAGRSQGLADCTDMMFAYDYASSLIYSLHDDQCTQIGFSFQQEMKSWSGTPEAAEPFSSTATLKAGTLVKSVDDYGRTTAAALLNDLTRPDDDLCVRIEYAVPTGTTERVLSAPKTRTTTLAAPVDGAPNPDPCASGNRTTFTSDTWEYDTLTLGQVAAGFVTGHTVSRRRTDDGTVINDAKGRSDIRLFDATYDPAGNPKTATTTRDDDATRTVTTDYDPFGLAPVNVKINATNVGGVQLPALTTRITLDPLTLDATSTTDPNGTQSGNTFDGFGRVLLSSVTPSGGGASGVLSSISYVGFAAGEPGGRSVVQKVFTDPVDPGNVASAAGRTATVFLDSLGREEHTEVNLGEDYANNLMIIGARVYDYLGRVLFEADPHPSIQIAGDDYGTTYYFNPDGTPLCFIRGRGLQGLKQGGVNVTDEAKERYPTCFSRRFADNQVAVSVTDPLASLPGIPPTNFIFRRSWHSAIGRTLGRETASFDNAFNEVVLEKMVLTTDRLGQLTSMARYPDPTLAANVTTSWNYDSLGQVLELHEPDNATQFRAYDSWGELTQTQWTDATAATPADRRTITTYDALGRMTHAEDRTNDDVDAETVNDYSYDQPANSRTPPVTATNVRGRLAQATSPTSTTSFSYDGLGRINAEVFTDTTTSKVYVEKHSFHGDGSPSALDLLLPDTQFKNEHVDYTYDSAGRSRSVSYTDDGGVTSKSLFTASGASAIDPLGRIRQAQYGGATYTASYADTGRRLINSVKVTSPSGKSREIAFPAPTEFITAFDAVGRERGRRETVDGNVGAATTRNFTYNRIGQLASMARTPADATLPNMSFSYDALGNVGSLTSDTVASRATLSYQTNDLDRICSVAYGSATPGSACNVQYDGVGNIIEQPTRSGVRKLTYFANGLVKRVTDGAATPQFDAQFRYGPFGNLEQLDVTSNTSPDTRHDRHFGALISTREEVVAAAKKVVTTRSIPGPGLIATRHGSAATDPWTFAFGDNRGNRFFTNLAGEFVQDVDYQAYGEAKPTGAQPGAQSYSTEQWNGGDALRALGLTQLGARLYDPVIGRFLSRDPLILPRTAATTNPYAFANNDPMNRSDPSGLAPECDALAYACAGGHGGPPPGDYNGSDIDYGPWRDSPGGNDAPGGRGTPPPTGGKGNGSGSGPPRGPYCGSTGYSHCPGAGGPSDAERFSAQTAAAGRAGCGTWQCGWDFSGGSALPDPVEATIETWTDSLSHLLAGTNVGVTQYYSQGYVTPDHASVEAIQRPAVRTALATGVHGGLLAFSLAAGGGIEAAEGGSGFEMALGLGRHGETGAGTLLGNFAERVGAKTYGDIYGNWWPGSMSALQTNIASAMSAAERLHFNLDHFSMRLFSRFMGNPVFSSGNITSWELGTILRTPSLLEKATFYGPGGIVVPPPPF